MQNSTHATWDFITGAEDIVTFGFSNTTSIDGGTWTASNRTDDSHAWEFGDFYYSDEGVKPFDVNSFTIFYEDYYFDMPIFDNNHIPIVDYASIPIGTSFAAYYPQTPTLSQTDFEIGWNWNESLHNGYSMEITRKLNTGNSDDILLNFSLADQGIFIGIADRESTYDMKCNVDYMNIGTTNIPANFTFNPITSPVTGDLFLTGIVQDDYDINYVEIKIFSENETQNPIRNWSTSIWGYTGRWDEEVLYNFDELPLGELNITVTIDPLYEDPITLWQVVDVQDNIAPVISGIVDLNFRYPYGIPSSETNVTIVAGVYDNYGSINLTVTLYYSTNHGVQGEVVMVPFSSQATTFNGEIPLPEVNASSENPTYHNFTFYIMAKDLMNHTTYSQNYSFIYPDILEREEGKWIKLAYIIPPSVLALGLIIALPIIFQRRKKRKKLGL
jgi:hypothetical protein